MHCNKQNNSAQTSFEYLLIIIIGFSVLIVFAKSAMFLLDAAIFYQDSLNAESFLEKINSSAKKIRLMDNSASFVLRKNIFLKWGIKAGNDKLEIKVISDKLGKSKAFSLNSSAMEFGSFEGVFEKQIELRLFAMENKFFFETIDN